MSDFTEKNNNTGHQGNPDNSTKTAESKEKKPLDTEGEYVDYEEIK